MIVRTPLLFVALALSAGLSAAADWPQWRGPDRTGISPETGLLTKFPAGGPKLVWSTDKAGLGYSSFAVVGDRLYTMGQEGREEFAVALDVKSGEPVWKKAIGSNYENNFGGGPRCTPTVDGDSLYFFSAKGDLACLAAKDGAVRWQVNLPQKYKGVMMSNWGYSESPLVDGDLVIASPGGDEGTVAAFDKKDGRLRWRSSGLGAKATYSSPVVCEVGGVRMYVQMTLDGLAGFAAADGKVLFQSAVGINKTAIIPTPVVKDNLVYVSGDYQTSQCSLVKLTPDGKGGVKADVVYTNKTLENHHGGVILIGDHVYGSHGSAFNKKALPFVCQDLKTGKAAWKQEDTLEPSAIVAADGHIYCYGQNTGTVAVVKASPAGFTETGRFTIPKETSQRKPAGGIWPHPVIANGKLYLRDQELLYCLDLKPGAVSE